MGSLSIREIVYRSAIGGDWENMVDYYEARPEQLLSPVTLSLDTGFHLAVHSNKGKPLEDLLKIMETEESSSEIESLKRKNKFGNTALHEATINGNYEAVRLLVERCADLLSIPNEDGETPLFTAAGFGQAGIVKFLILSQQEQCVDDQWRLLPIHRQRSKDEQSILGAAIVGQHFETALLLLEVDESLHSMEDSKKRTALQLLAEIPSAFESGFPMGIFQRLFYCCLPARRYHEIKLKEEIREQASQGTVIDPESGLGSSSKKNPEGGKVNRKKIESTATSILSCCRFLPQGYWPATLAGLWNKKTKHVFALRLAKILIDRDESWDSVSGTEEGQDEKQTGPPSSQVKQGDLKKKNEEELGVGGENNEKGENELSTTGQNSEISSKRKDTEEVQNPTPQTSAITTKEKNMRKGRIPLFIATRNGIIEIVSEIIEIHPHAVEQLNEKGQSILNVAVMHRQEKIFSLVKQRKIPMARLHRVLDKEGNTLLHHVADMEYYRGGTKPGPALKLQEELQWFEQVRDVIPSHYVTLPNDEGKTAGDLFNASHKEQLENARTWIKETTQSCSTVSALVATVVFAAAYTVPGGSDENGKPNFIDSPYFLVFTVSDVLSLASSLTSLVIFLSMLTSPFELQDFRISLPRKLIWGFSFLFFAVITTMLSFGATILILIQSERKLTTLLLSIAAFLPVLVFAIMQFQLYVSFMGSTVNILKMIWKDPPSFHIPCLPCGTKHRRVD